jgi:hypothetical protein
MTRGLEFMVVEANTVALVVMGIS